MYTAEELASSVTRLASPPLVYQRVRQVLGDPDSSMQDLVKVIEVDPSITAKLLKIVNSPYYGFRNKVETVERAVKLLGTQQVHDLALATSVTALFNGISPVHMNMAQYWHYSVYCGLAARALAECCQISDSERLFVEGLLCDIGHLVIYEKVPDLAEKAMANTEKDGSPLYLEERALIGCDYAQVGAALMQGWNIPSSLQNSVRYHTEPALAAEDNLEISLVHIARLMASAIDSGHAMDQVQLRVETQVWQSTGLKVEHIIAVHERADQDTMAVVNTLFSNLAKVDG
jgi:HD-like signal output (HDOD) protein